MTHNTKKMAKICEELYSEIDELTEKLKERDIRITYLETQLFLANSRYRKHVNLTIERLENMQQILTELRIQPVIRSRDISDIETAETLAHSGG